MIRSDKVVWLTEISQLLWGFELFECFLVTFMISWYVSSSACLWYMCMYLSGVFVRWFSWNLGKGFALEGREQSIRLCGVQPFDFFLSQKILQLADQ